MTLLAPIAGPAAWTGADLAHRTDWIYALSAEEIADVERVVAAVRAFFIPWYIRRAQELPEVPRMSAAQQAALAAVETIANDPALYLDMEFRPGDVQLLKNSVILHKRTEYEDWEDADRKRHLLRLWLAAPDFDDGDEQLRGGIALA